MKTVSYAQARSGLGKLLDQVNEDRAPITITRQNGTSAVLVSAEEWESWSETRHLLSTPANARALTRSIRQAAQGKARVRKLRTT